MPTPPPANGIRFDRTINLGHILTFVGFLITASVGWSSVDKRVTVLEEARASQRERDQSQDAVNKDKFQEVKDSLGDLKRSVEKIADKVGAK